MRDVYRFTGVPDLPRVGPSALDQAGVEIMPGAWWVTFVETVDLDQLEFGSWAQPCLYERFGVDLAGDPHYQPGYAPAGWTALTHHLRGRGVTDHELLVAGLSTRASTGRLIDRFRDRAVLPIVHHGPSSPRPLRRRTARNRSQPPAPHTRTPSTAHQR